MQEGRKKETLFVAAGEEKKRAPQGDYQQMVKIIFNSSVILCGLGHIGPAVLGSRNSQPWNCRTVLLQISETMLADKPERAPSRMEWICSRFAAPQRGIH